MKLIYTIQTKLINNKQYLAGYSLARESDDNPLGPDEMIGPLPNKLYTDEMQPCWVFQENGTLVYDPAPLSDTELLKKELANLQAYLAETDWYVIRSADNGTPIPLDIADKREQARKRISEIRSLLS